MDKWTLDSAKRHKDKFYVDETSAKFGPHVRWNSNDRVPFDDMLECFQHLGWIDLQTRENSTRARDADTAAFLAEYRANYRGPSEEELAEARAEFGAGATVVNVFTGHRYTV
nr:hypothetical protein [Oxalobacteraceae bacterium]